MTMQHPAIAAIVRRDPRYRYEAYEFMFDAVAHAQKLVGRIPIADRDPEIHHHVSGRELLRGAVDLARCEFGLMAKSVFHQWGIRITDDVGEIIFNLIEAGLLSKTDNDHRSDFHDVFDIDRALADEFTIPLAEVAWAKRGVK